MENATVTPRGGQPLTGAVVMLDCNTTGIVQMTVTLPTRVDRDAVVPTKERRLGPNGETLSEKVRPARVEPLTRVLRFAAQDLIRGLTEDSPIRLLSPTDHGTGQIISAEGVVEIDTMDLDIVPPLVVAMMSGSVADFIDLITPSAEPAEVAEPVASVPAPATVEPGPTTPGQPHRHMSLPEIVKTILGVANVPTGDEIGVLATVLAAGLAQQPDSETGRARIATLEWSLTDQGENGLDLGQREDLAELLQMAPGLLIGAEFDAIKQLAQAILRDRDSRFRSDAGGGSGN